MAWMRVSDILKQDLKNLQRAYDRMQHPDPKMEECEKLLNKFVVRDCIRDLKLILDIED